jgi:hypothetical protein
MMFSFGLEMDYKHDSDGRLMDGLLVIADAAAQVAYPGNEAYLGNQWGTSKNSGFWFQKRVRV